MNTIQKKLVLTPNESATSKPQVEQEQKYKTTKSWNPSVGCKYNCVYCNPIFGKMLLWVGAMRHCDNCKKYAPHSHPERLDRIPSDKAIFVCEDGDVSFAPSAFMKEVIIRMRDDKKKDRVWFLQSKNPKCFNQYLELLPSNTYLVTTLETNRDENYSTFSSAPKPSQRFMDFKELPWAKKIVTVEPIMQFDLDVLSDWILRIKPNAVFIGYNSKPKAVALPEPSIEEAWELIHTLRKSGLHTLTKDMRDPKIPKKAYRDILEEL